MYGLPDSFEPSIFVGRVIEQMSFTPNTLFVGFDHDISITIMGEFRYALGDQLHPTRQAVPVANSSVMSLVGKRVRSADTTPNGTLTLHFDPGCLVLVDDSPTYESYTLRLGEREIIV